MFQYLINLLNFQIGNNTYNLITSPWEYIINWVSKYESQYQSSYPSTAVRDAWVELGKIAVGQAALVLVLVVVCVWFFWRVCRGFIGWMEFR